MAKYRPGIGGHSAPDSTAAALILVSVQQVLATRAATVLPPSDWPAAAISWLFRRPDNTLLGSALSFSRLLSTKDMSGGWFTRSFSFAAVTKLQLVLGNVTAAATYRRWPRSAGGPHRRRCTAGTRGRTGAAGTDQWRDARLIPPLSPGPADTGPWSPAPGGPGAEQSGRLGRIGERHLLVADLVAAGVTNGGGAGGRAAEGVGLLGGLAAAQGGCRP